MLQQVLDYIEKNGVLYPEKISQDLEIDLEDVLFALDFWQKKGKIAHRTDCKSCDQSCENCTVFKRK